MHVEPMLGGDMSHLEIGYWDGMDMHKVMNIEGSDEVVEITYDREDKEPSDGIGKDDPTDEMVGTESFAMWYGSVGPTSLREASHTPNNSDIDANKEGHAEDTSSDEGVDTGVSMET